MYYIDAKNVRYVRDFFYLLVYFSNVGTKVTRDSMECVK